MADTRSLAQLRQILGERFSQGDLRDLCMDLGVDYEDLPGSGKVDRARELVAFLERHERLPDLVQVGRRARPDIAWPDVGAARPAAAPLLHTLPLPVVDFTGREGDVQQVLQHAGRQGAASVCAIRGMGGLGKTQLALEVARQLGPSYPDAQLMLELQPGNSPLAPEAVLAAVVRAFLPDARLPDALPELQGLYCSVLAGKRGLLLLDNAADAGQVRPLLPPPAGWAVIVTARSRFPLPGGYLHELGLLPGAEAVALLRRIFADSGREDLAGADLAALAGLCGHLPLALRVAAGHLTSFPDETFGEYLAVLRRARLAGLQAPGEPAVAAVLGLGVGRLRREDPALAGRWHDLAVFPAPFDQEAAAAVWEADAETARAALSGLAQQCLVEYDADRRTYGLHDLLREYALAEPVPDEVVLRHAEHYLARGSAAVDLYLQGGAHVLEGLAAVDLAWPHLSAAWLALKERRDMLALQWLSDYPLRLAYVMELRLAASERVAILECGLAAARELGDRYSEGLTVGNLGTAYADLGDARKAIEYYEEALAIAREIGDRRGEGAALGNLGLAYAAVGDARKASAYHEQALAIAREIGDRRGEGADLGNLGLAYAALGDARKASAYHEQALAIAREIGDRRGEGAALGNLGLAYAALGDARKAIEFYGQALAIDREIGDRRGEGAALGNLGLAYAALGDGEHARKLWQQALAIFEAISDRRGEGSALANLGAVSADLRNWDIALDYYQRAQALARGFDDRASEAAALSNIGNVWAQKGQLDSALNAYQQALDIQKSIGDQAGFASTQDAISSIYRSLEETSRPLSLVMSEAQRFFQAAGFTLGTTGEVGSFICQAATPLWQQKVKGDVYVTVMVGQPLDGDGVLRVRQTIENTRADITKAFILVDKIVQDDAWLQIAALRPGNFHVVPIPVSLFSEGKAGGKIANEAMTLSKHLERFIGRGYDPYDVRDPVSDVLNFFGRETLANELKDRLMAGQPIGLFGLRKMGKSSLMQFMQNLMPCPTARLDLQAGTNLVELYERILRAWSNDAQARFNLDLGLQGVKLSGANDPSSEFVRCIQNALDQLVMQNPELRLAIFLDEIELIVPPDGDAGLALERYLALTRTLRGLLQEDRRVLLMVAGVDAFVNRIIRWGNEQNPFYQLLQEVYLPPLRSDDCIIMIRNVGGRVELSYSDATAAYIADASGGHPFLARQLCSLAYKQRTQQPGEVSLESVQAAAERFLFDPQYSTATLGDTGLWNEISNIRLWDERVSRANQAVLIALAQSPVPLRETKIINGSDAASKRSSLFALQQLAIIRATDDVSEPSDPSYAITFGLFRSWIRRVRLGFKE